MQAQVRTIRRRLAALVLVAVVAAACAGNLTPKVQINRADRVAFEALRGLQVAETAAFRAGATWPSADAHRAINARLSAAYSLVIDVANIGLSLKPGEAMPADVRATLALLGTTVADIVALVGPQAGADVRAQAEAVERAAGDLAAAVEKGAQP